MTKTHGTTLILKNGARKAKDLVKDVVGKIADLTDEVDVQGIKSSVLDLDNAKNRVRVNDMKHSAIDAGRAVGRHLSKLGKVVTDGLKATLDKTLTGLTELPESEIETARRPYPIAERTPEQHPYTDPHTGFRPGFQWRTFIVVVAILMLTCFFMFLIYLVIEQRRQRMTPAARDLELGYTRPRASPLAHPSVNPVQVAPRLTPTMVETKNECSDQPPAYQTADYARAALR